MPNGKDSIAQAFYLAQLQACKGTCKCKVCQLLRKAADLQSTAFLNPQAAKTPGDKPAIPGVEVLGLGDNPLAEEEE